MSDPRLPKPGTHICSLTGQLFPMTIMMVLTSNWNCSPSWQRNHRRANSATRQEHSIWYLKFKSENPSDGVRQVRVKIQANLERSDDFAWKINAKRPSPLGFSHRVANLLPQIDRPGSLGNRVGIRVRHEDPSDQSRRSVYRGGAAPWIRCRNRNKFSLSQHCVADEPTVQ